MLICSQITIKIEVVLLPNNNKNIICFAPKAIKIESHSEYLKKFVEKGFGSGYCGIHHILPTPYVGLKQGIKEVYNKLKNEY
jgi:hypothetical protein